MPIDRIAPFDFRCPRMKATDSNERQCLEQWYLEIGIDDCGYRSYFGQKGQLRMSWSGI